MNNEYHDTMLTAYRMLENALTQNSPTYRSLMGIDNPRKPLTKKQKKQKKAKRRMTKKH